MKRKLLFIVVMLFCFANSLVVLPIFANSNYANNSPRIAIVIDDFGGYNRSGVKEMLSLDCPLTCAVMPKLPYTKKDANLAHANGKEVILHMPMEAYSHLPESWYGTCYIKNYDTEEQAKNLLKECFEDVPYAVGMNIHIGSGVSRNKCLMKCIIQTAHENGKFFLDSWTTSKSVCDCAANELGIKYLKRFEFLERTGQRSYSYATEMLKHAVSHAKKFGDTIIIGHIGAEGGTQTYEAIRDFLPTFKAENIKLVKLSEMIL